MTADDRLEAVWRVEECTDEYRENCPCMIVTGNGDRVQYAADAETPELAARIVADHNEVIALREQLAKYVGKEPTLRDEMAYLNRCLDAVFGLCREADKDGNTSDGKFTPAAVLQAASGEREDDPNDRRRRLYLDGEGSVWVDGSVSPDGTRWIGYVVHSGGQSTHEEVRARTGELHEIGRTW